ncbi:hypothetical protein [Nocardioides pakistanensis]
MNQASGTILAAESTTWPWLASVEKAINEFFDPLADTVSGAIFYAPNIFGAEVPLIVFWLVLAAAIFTIYFRGIQFTGFPTSLALVRGKFSRESDPGEVTTSRRSPRRCREPSGSATSPVSASPSRSVAPVRRSG